MHYLDLARSPGACAVAGEYNEVNLYRQVKLTNQVSHKNEATFEDTD